MHTLLLPGEVHKSEKSNNCYEKLIVGASSEYKSAFQTLLILPACLVRDCSDVTMLLLRTTDGCVTIRQYAGPGPGLGPGPDTYTGDAGGIQTLLNTRTNLGHN